MARTLIIGDVHGCARELDELLDKAAITTSDRVVFVGDLVGRGPDSCGVLDRAAGLNAVAVQGNHERHLLQLAESRGVPRDVARVPAARLSLLDRLEPQHLEFLRKMPVFFELPRHAACVVHAGVVSNLDWAAQDPWVLTNIRSFDGYGRPSAELGDRSWAVSYSGAVHVIFGHCAQRGLQIYDHATGLDTGCVYGGELTGLLLMEGEPIPAREVRLSALVSVAAHSTYCPIRSS